MVTGDLVRQTVACAGTVRTELLQRHSERRISWHFRQPQLALFWFHRGIRSMELRTSDRQYHRDITAHSDLLVIPPGVELRGQFDVAPESGYVAVFFEHETLDEVPTVALPGDLVSCDDTAIRRSLVDLAREATVHDEFFDLFAEGWALQTLARLGRRISADTTSRRRSGLSPRDARKVRSYVADNLREPVSVAILASMCGLSPSHFIRAFKTTFGLTPMRYVLEERLERGRHLLTHSTLDVTAIAITCGFVHPQHFATRFKAQTSLTPTQYRRFAQT
jgi:AraC family transcriptional regulator